MSYNDPKFLQRLDDPLAEDVALDHEITPTVIYLTSPDEQPRRPTTPLIDNTRAVGHDIQHQTHRMQRRLDYELLNQFLLHCELGHVLHIEKFIKHPNIDIDFQNTLGHTPAMVAIIHNPSSYSTPQLVQKLLDGGADADITDYDGKTVFNYACNHNQEGVLYTLIKSGVNTYHRLLPTLSQIQQNGSLNILYTLITHFALEKVTLFLCLCKCAIYTAHIQITCTKTKEFSARCGVCNHPLKAQEPLKKAKKGLRCCIGNKPICANQIYYACGSQYGCWGNYTVCSDCHEYGILRFMMDVTRTKKYNSLSRLEKYDVDKQIKKHNLENPLLKYQKAKLSAQKGLHFYSSYPHHFEYNIHSPLDDEKKSTEQAFAEIDDAVKAQTNDKDSDDSDDDDNDRGDEDDDDDDSDDDDSDDDDSESDSDSDGDDDGDDEQKRKKKKKKKKAKRERKDSDEAPNFKEGDGLKLMRYILNKREYWYGASVLKEKEWREIYWMDINMQLKWLILLRRNIFNAVRVYLVKDNQMSPLIVDILMEMMCGTNRINGCFLK